MAGVRLDRVTKRFGRVEAVRALDLDVHDGELLTLVGPSGCGKTTTLRLIAGLESPTSGDVFFDGERMTRVPPGGRDIAMIFQLYALYPYLSVRENIAFPLRARGLPARKVHAEVQRVAELVGVDDLLDRYPKDVHPADGQRVAIAKAIVRQPRVFLFDEPLSHLDAQLRAEMRTEIKHLHDSVGRTMIFVTHDQAEALALSDRIGVMRAGKIVQLGTPEEVFHRPADAYVAQFVGVPPINLIPVEFAGTPDDGWVIMGRQRVRLPSLSEARDAAVDLHGRSRCLLGIRPRYVSLGQPEGLDGLDGGVNGVVEVLEPRGRDVLVHVRIGPDVAVRALVPARERPADAQNVRVSFDASRVLLFDSANGRSLIAAT